ncbi:MAG: phosphopantothenate/pantothenate synthetase [Halobacteria archaeon]
MKPPRSHPRFRSLVERASLVEGWKRGLVADAGLLAHGRGEAFDYLLGERTTPEARRAARAGVALLRLARRPVISVNGNAAVLAGRDLARLGRALGAPLEVNLFYRSPGRERLLVRHLRSLGAERVLSGGGARLPGLESSRRRVHPDGILRADAVLVPLEDGDRTEVLARLGKRVVAVDLNPLSRTSRRATVTVVDNLTRCAPLMASMAREMDGWPGARLARTSRLDNRANLRLSVERMGAAATRELGRKR